MKELVENFLSFINSNSALWSFLVTVATIVYVVLTYRLLNETKKARLDSIQPYILADIILKNNFLNLVVHNHGNDAAFNIEVKLNPAINTSLKNIKFLPPNGKLTQNLLKLAPKNEGDTFQYSVEIKYINSSKKQFIQTYEIDLTPLKGLGLIVNNHETKAIELLNKNISELTSEVKNLNGKITNLTNKIPKTK